MKVLVTGANGQLGYDVIKRLDSEGIQYLGTDRYSLDITNKEKVKRIIDDYNPDVVVHCAAYTAVDKAEDEREQCHSVNVLGTKNIVTACKQTNSKMVYISTDYVFDGERNKSFEVTDKTNPINYYGQTKREGELEVQNQLDKYFIVRISWVFGSRGNNFVKTMLRLGKDRDEITVVADQIGSPTYTYDLAKLLVEMIRTEKYGIYHATNEGYCSWYDFACEIFEQAGISVAVKPIKTKDYPTKAKRPVNSRLSKKSLSVFRISKLPQWKEALSNFLIEEYNQVKFNENLDKKNGV
jgi:dTDP-4-dehydrorhamnose reductase